jgi:hypothetical protein
MQQTIGQNGRIKSGPASVYEYFPNSITGPLTNALFKPSRKAMIADMAMQQKMTQFMLKGDTQGKGVPIHPGIINDDQIFFRNRKRDKEFVAG